MRSRDDLLAIVRVAEDGIRRDRFETLLVFDVFGQEILRKPGQHDRVSVTPAEQRRMRGRIVTHNHPHGWSYPPSNPRHQGNSFSPEDVSLAITAGVAEMRAVTPVWRYSFRPGPGQRWGTQFFTRVVEPAFRQANGDVRRDFQRAIVAGTLTPAQARADFFHEVWTRVAARTGVQYDREMP